MSKWSLIATGLTGKASGAWARVPRFLLLSLTLIVAACTQGEPRVEPSEGPPRLVVGIVVDQMRHDYLRRYQDKYSEDGFKRLLKEGFSFDNARFDYMPTYTAPGHASIYTGTTPAVHGIISNYWYSRESGSTLYAVGDANYRTVGADGTDGEMSPHQLLSTTVGDELRLHSNERSRVVGLSLKARSAILPAGHTGEAYWLDADSGRFITSTYYRDVLPDWVSAFNERKLVDHYLEGTWETLLPIEQYVESIADDNPYEAPFRGEERPVFPRDLAALTQHSGRGLVAVTPFGNELLLELAFAALEGEQLGKGEHTDILAISFSSTDRIGHQFGPASIEVQDTYLRLDRQLARLLDYLDEHYGKGEVLVFLTTDHGVAHVPAYLRDRKIPAGRFISNDVLEKLRVFSRSTYGEDFIEAFSDQQVFLDTEKLDNAEVEPARVRADIARFLLGVEGVAGTVTADALVVGEFSDDLRGKVQRGFHQKRSGDVMAWLEPNGVSLRHDTVRAIHGSPYNYDTRAPLIWYGWQVPAGRSTERVNITDIASTLAIILEAPFPGANTGNPMNHLMLPAD